MNEDEIAAKLRLNIPQPDEPTAPTIAPVTTDEQSSIIPERPSELTIMKLGHLLGEDFPIPPTVEKLTFIHDRLVELTGTKETDKLIQMASVILGRMGKTYEPKRLYHLYTYLGLHRDKQIIEQEMERVVNG